MKNVKSFCKSYVKEITNIEKLRDTREESYYHVFVSFLKNISNSIGNGCDFIVLPRENGLYPDIKAVKNGDIVGYIELKRGGTDLGSIAKSEQIAKYKKTFTNFMLTNYHDFVLYRSGVVIKKVSLFDWESKKLIENNVQPVIELLNDFFSFSSNKEYTSEGLARELARLTKILKRDGILPELDNKDSSIYSFFETFKKYFMSEIDKDNFANLYSQTITFGLFSAKLVAKDKFTRADVVNFIPDSIGILKEIFKFISSEEPNSIIKVIVEDIVNVLQKADLDKILKEKIKDGHPILHFYETFLSEYDPEERKRKGVYYTPLPVVKYMVSAVNEILVKEFNIKDGLADRRVTILDPAAGTMTFILEIMQQIHDHVVSKYGEGALIDIANNHILKNIYAFEILIAPYVIGHINVTNFLKEKFGLELGKDKRFNLFLTNTLADEKIEETIIPIVKNIAEENKKAREVKKEKDIMVIIGNPPYSIKTSNNFESVKKMMKTDEVGAPSYYKIDGKPLGKNTSKLADDYIKFIRWAQLKINKNKVGIVAFITNSNYLASAGSVGMRKSILETFNKIYVIDLGGDVMAIDNFDVNMLSDNDENIFNIKTPVCISIFVKNGKNDKEVRYVRVKGTKEYKFNWLLSNTKDFYRETDLVNINKTDYIFVSTNRNKNFYKFISMEDIFKVYSKGISTGYNDLFIDFDKHSLLNKLLDKIKNPTFKNKESDKYVEKLIKFYNSSNVKGIEGNILEISFRPFDLRHVFYDNKIIVKPMLRTMLSMIHGDNIGIVASYIKTHKLVWQDALVCNKINLDGFISNKSGSFFFPLYIIDKGVFGKSYTSNIKDLFIKFIKNLYNKDVKPIEILSYIYAILYSNIYRNDYDDYLSYMVPRIPITGNYELFCALSNLGQELIKRHLLKDFESDLQVKYEGNGNHIVEDFYYNDLEKRIYINKTQHFTNVSPEVWLYGIGSYQVIKMYLKSRTGRSIANEILHIIKMIQALHDTIKIQEQIDELYPKVEENLADTNELNELLKKGK